jgi:23S rRNA pseudouridine2605 synthase
MTSTPTKSPSDSSPEAKSERIQKILARAGIASRRKCEELITEGSVTVNGKVASLGDKAIPGKDAIKVNGKLLQAPEAPVYIAFYKPRAVISMLVDNENRPNLSDYLTKVRTRVFPIGRLDFNSEGLILLTNDGEFAEKVQKRDDIPRVYSVKVKGHADAAAIKALEKGARIDYQMVRPHSVRRLRELETKTQLQVVIQGGGAVDLRGLCEMKGLLVDKITRTAIGHITTAGMVPGQLKMLRPSQAQMLLDQPELGLKMLEQQVEAEKPKGQRNIHAKKEGSEEIGSAFEAPPSAPKSVVKPLAKPISRSSFEKPRFSARKSERPAFGAGEGRAERSFAGSKPFGKPEGKRAPSASAGGVRRRGAAPANARGGASSFANADRRERNEGGEGMGSGAKPRGGFGGGAKPRGSFGGGSSAGGSKSRGGYGVVKPRRER